MLRGLQNGTAGVEGRGFGHGAPKRTHVRERGLFYCRIALSVGQPNCLKVGAGSKHEGSKGGRNAFFMGDGGWGFWDTNAHEATRELAAAAPVDDLF